MAALPATLNATGLRLTPGVEIGDLLGRAFETWGPLLVDGPIDYSENEKLSRDLAAGVRRLLESR